MSPARLDLTERVAWITLDRPPANLLDLDMLRQLDQILASLSRNRKATVVVLSGAGERAFCAGMDVALRRPDQLEPMLEQYLDVLRGLARLPQVTMAAINGVALGAGLELCNLCDLAVASTRSQLGYPEVNLACFPPLAVAAMPGNCPRQVLADLILTGESVGAAQAQEIGLISRVLSEDSFDQELGTLVTALLAKSPTVLRLTVKALRRQWWPRVETALAAVEQFYRQEIKGHPDLREGVTAFLEKRKPDWI